VTDRLEQLRSGLAAVERRIRAACADAGRDPDEVRLVVVTKTFPASDVRLLAELGVTDVAENKQQELAAKHEELAGEVPVRWHFVGHLQSNKAGAVAEVADVVHSVDRTKLLGPMDRRAQDHGHDLEVLLQVSLDPAGSEHRSGASPDELPALADRVIASDRLVLRGLMAVAPLGEDPADAFARLAQIRAGVLAAHPSATWLSAGMSGDLEHAVRAGATHVRVGSAVLGSRPSVQ
jgi:pyridoxal phosphate enzyme (YggS family)